MKVKGFEQGVVGSEARRSDADSYSDHPQPTATPTHTAGCLTA